MIDAEKEIEYLLRAARQMAPERLRSLRKLAQKRLNQEKQRREPTSWVPEEYSGMYERSLYAFFEERKEC
jgi:hypothetical protein